MSPIPSAAAAFALSAATPSVGLDPDSAGQSASTMSQHLVGTGGLVFAVVAIVSVAGYLYHGRGSTSSAKKNSAWTTFGSLLSSVRHRRSDTAMGSAMTEQPAVTEVDPEHVNMIYARFLHPTFWNLVEYHPATPNAPAICVEDEASEIPASKPKLYGMNSFLDMDDDHDGEGTKNYNTKGVREPGARPRAAKVPPYDTSTMTNTNFRSEIIGTTDRPGGLFLVVPGEHEDASSETSSSDEASQASLDTGTDFTCSPYDGFVAESELDNVYLPCGGTLTASPRMDFTCSPHDGILTDSQSEYACSPYGGILETPPASSSDLTFNLSCSPYGEIASDLQQGADHPPHDGTLRTPSRPLPSTRRYGMADMAGLAQSLKNSITEEGYGLVRTTGHRSGLCDLADFDETNLVTFRGRVDHLDVRPGNEPTGASWGTGVHGSLRKQTSDTRAFVPAHEGPDLMRIILEELRDANMECAPRSLSEGSVSEYDCDDDSDDDDDGMGRIPRLTPMWYLDSTGQMSLEWTSSTLRTDSDVSEGGSIYPVTPPPRSAMSLLGTPRMYMADVESPIGLRSNKGAQVIVPTRSCSPPWLTSKGYLRTHKPSHPLPIVWGSSLLPYLAPEVA